MAAYLGTGYLPGYGVLHDPHPGKCLVSSEEASHAITRHLADYVLVWKGGSGDDLAKSAHMARIGTSVFRGHCAEADCDAFGVHADGTPSAMMAEALIYRL